MISTIGKEKFLNAYKNSQRNTSCQGKNSFLLEKCERISIFLVNSSKEEMWMIKGIKTIIKVPTTLGL
jgi:hypothetical protein